MLTTPVDWCDTYPVWGGRVDSTRQGWPSVRGYAKRTAGGILAPAPV